MKSNISFVKGISVVSLFLILFLGIYLFNSPVIPKDQNSNYIHTYLIEIPATAGICPYILTSKSHGKLQLVDYSKCTCPYAEHDTYLITRCRGKNSVLALFPSSLQNKLKIMVIDNFKNNPYPKSLDSKTHIAGF